MRTDLQREREEQRRWRLRPRFAEMRSYNHLVENEFLSEEEQRDRQAMLLRRIVRIAATAVPYYEEVFAERGLRPEDIRSPDDLPKLPVLTKGQLRQDGKRLEARSLPSGEKVWGSALSSGTTGHPTRVLHTVNSNGMFSLLVQRQYRWFRLNPERSLAFIRVANDLPRQPDGNKYPDGTTCRWSRWRYAGVHFETGPWYGLTMTTPIAQQLDWLREARPAYLAAHSSWLEHLTYAAEGHKPVDSVEAIVGLVEQVTPPMRARVERIFAAPLNEAYGMNEIGLVAARCAAGRFHVHAEHCLVEIVDQDGQPCAPGQSGRLLVTGLRNAAMPLIRYDVDDQAEAVAGPCPCGRTLPSFVNLVGRYRRHAALPAGSYALYSALNAAIVDLPDDLACYLRQFQVHQYRDNRFEVRLVTAAPLPAAGYELLRAAWNAAIGERTESLQIIEVDGIPRPPNGKLQTFTSDYQPGPDDPLA